MMKVNAKNSDQGRCIIDSIRAVLINIARKDINTLNAFVDANIDKLVKDITQLVSFSELVIALIEDDAQLKQYKLNQLREELDGFKRTVDAIKEGN